MSADPSTVAPALVTLKEIATCFFFAFFRIVWARSVGRRATFSASTNGLNAFSSRSECTATNRPASPQGVSRALSSMHCALTASAARATA